MIVNEINDEEFYSDLLECSDIDGRVLRNSELEVRENKNKNPKFSKYKRMKINSNKRFKKKEFSQEGDSQDTSFNTLSDEIESINNRIDHINSNIESIMNDSSSSICILEQIVKYNNLEENQRFIGIGTSGIKIGRSIDCEIPKRKYSREFMKLSRNHAYIYIKKNNNRFESHIVDCNSTNGTFVNNRKIRDHILKKNDIIIFGNYEKNFDNLGNDQDEFYCRYKVIKA